MLALAVVSEREIYIGGKEAAFLWDGADDFRKIDAPGNVHFYSFAIYQGEIYAGSLKGVFKLVRDAFEPVSALALSRIYALNGKLVGVGGLQTFGVFDGTRWKSLHVDVAERHRDALEQLADSPDYLS